VTSDLDELLVVVVVVDVDELPLDVVTGILSEVKLI
jgi:hypothetical protein